MALLQLRGGQVAQVDDEDLERVNPYRWSFGDRYVISKIDGKMTRLHRFILRPPPGLHVDHINHDTLDNRKDNLRLCTHSMNMANRLRPKGAKNPYKGLEKHRNGWKALICGEYIGKFKTPEEAAKAYDKAALAKWGAVAILNFPT
jgi:hypothetical protein